MNKPLNQPGSNPMEDGIALFKKMWSGAGMPGMAMPSMSVEDVKKQIIDLKAVDTWLTANQNMLRTTIQALEVQSATLETLKDITAKMPPATQQVMEAALKPAMAAGMPKTGFPGAAEAATAFGHPAAASAWWDLMQNQFQQAVANVTQAGEAFSTVIPAKKGESAAPAAKKSPPAKPRAPAKRG